MKKNSRSFLKHAMILLVTLILLALGFSEIFRPKFLNDNYWPLDVTYHGFYEMKKDSVDVIFLGSSHAISAFSPQELYDRTNIRSFNLASEEQSLVVSYYWLKEALRFQSPSAVVIDTATCFPFTEKKYNCNEPSIRKAIDPMHWSMVKLEAVNAIHGMDAEESLASYVFPIIRYHARWNDLSRNDIHFWPRQRTDLKGYSILSEDCGIEDYQPLEENSETIAGTHPVMMEYLKKIHDLCRKKDMTLLLVSTPYVETDSSRHAAMASFAKEEGITFIDFNTKEILEAMDFDFAKDMADGGHANNRGAVKMTGFMAEVLSNSGISGTPDSQYEDSREYVNRQIKNANLYRIENMHDYLSAIDFDDYLMFVTASTGTASLLEQEGISLSASGPFAAVKTDEWKVSDQKISGSSLALNTSWNLTSSQDTGRIEVYGKTYERKRPGIEFVLLDREKGYVMDHSCFDEAGNRISETD